MPGYHAKLSPSASNRWLTCPGSLDLPRSGEEEESVYAAEGTAAHELAEKCLILGVDAEELIGETLYDHEVTQEMADNVQVYLDVCNQLRREHDLGGNVEFYLSHSKIDDFGGTADFMMITPDMLYIVDLKYGAGHVVEVSENDQLKCYAVLAMDYVFKDIPSPENYQVRMTIVQPRASHEDGPVRSVTLSKEEIWSHEDRIQKQVFDNRHHLEAGSHCRWCPAKVHCPKLKEHTVAAAKAEFQPEGLSLEDAAELIQLRKPMEAYLDEVYRWLHGRMEKGEEVPGMKLVESFGNRRWTLSEDELIAEIKKMKRVAKDKLYDLKLKSPSQMEKVIGKGKLDDLIERPRKGTTVVPDYDKRPAVETKTAKEEFGEAN